MATPITRAQGEHKLSLADALDFLRQRGALRADRAGQLTDEGDAGNLRHPFIHIANLGLQSDTSPGFPLTLETVTRLAAEACRLPYVRIDPLKIDVEAVTGLVSQAYATRFQILPLSVTEQEVTIATAEPFIREWEVELTRALNRVIRRVVASPVDIERYLKEFYGVSRSIFGAAAGKAGERDHIIGDFEQLTELGSVGEPDANDQHIVHLVDWLLQYAFEQRASDIHIEPRRVQGNIRFRIDGILHVVHQMPTPVMGAITSRLKSLGRMDVADKRRPQDGRIKTRAPKGDEVELRLSTMPTTFGEKLVLRIFDPEKLTQPFSALGFSERELSRWQELVSRPHGIALVTGPTGSGKTTTLYSALKQLGRPEINVCTIEDPIELVEPDFNQMQVQPAIDLGFASGVRTLLRQDPDIIMIGEIRDKETADVAVQAALTGHLVLSTLHTNDAPSAITRLVDIGVQPYLISATLLGVAAQRLLRILCRHCLRPADLDPGAWETLVQPYELERPTQAHRAVGCDECRHTGYIGREGIYEVLTVTNQLSRLIHSRADTLDLRRCALREGMEPLRISGARKIADGKTTLEEVLSVVPAPGDGAA
jgi:general secretion pathway protein E